ncbi:MAG TPA: cellulase family glycosylhydrolase [Candidatus Dormibacteraeota bacterium]|nr:cellulase family glycosylhydrolase [Candidatus Dormibacteraeota bacterium]
MRFLLLAFLGAFGVWLFAPVPGLSASVPRPERGPAQPGLPWLSTAAGRIVDSTGRAVTLRGFNDDALLEPSMHPAPLDDTDATLMRSSGFDVVRLPIAWSLLEPQRGRFDDAYLERIARAVQMLNAHQLYVVLDMHSLGWSPVYGGSGAPAWATLGGVPDPVWGPMPSLPRLLSPAINASTAYFWLTSEWQDEFLATWRFVVQRFRDNSGVAGYDLYNEPHSFPLPPLRFDKDQLFPFYARAVTSVGAVDANHIFFLDNDMAGDLPTSVVQLQAPDLVYAPHVYTGALIPPDFSGDTSNLDSHVEELVHEAQSVPAALWFGEFSINIDHAYAAQWIQGILADFDAHNAGWAWWQWRETSGWGVRSADGRTLDMQLLRLLARPYVVAAPSGVSTRLTGGAHTAITVNVAARHGAGTIAVSWPGYVLGAPAVRNGCGATIAWDAAAARVLIDAPASTSCTVVLSA